MKSYGALFVAFIVIVFAYYSGSQFQRSYHYSYFFIAVLLGSIVLVPMLIKQKSRLYLLKAFLLGWVLSIVSNIGIFIFISPITISEFFISIPDKSLSTNILSTFVMPLVLFGWLVTIVIAYVYHKQFKRSVH